MNNAACRILIVDDEDIVRLNLVSYFEDEGYQVYSAQTGEEALQLLASNPCDIGIIDVRLPKIDGASLILQARNFNPKMKFIIHTGSIDYSVPDVLGAIGITSENVFIKPVYDMRILLEASQKLFMSNNAV